MQNRRGLIFLGFALAMGIAAAWLTQRLAPGPSENADTRTTPVVVVRTSVPVAASLTRDQLRTTDWPAAHVPAGALQSAEQAVDRVVRLPWRSAEPAWRSSPWASVGSSTANCGPPFGSRRWTAWGPGTPS